MSVGPLGMIGSAAGTPLSQAKGTETDKAVQDTTDQSRQARSAERAEQAAGIGQTREEEATTDRDADGRRPWERPARAQSAEESAETTEAAEATDPPASKDPSGTTGTQLDLTG